MLHKYLQKMPVNSSIPNKVMIFALLFATCFHDVKADRNEDSVGTLYDEIYRVILFLIALHYMGELGTLANMPPLIGQLVTGVILGPQVTGFVPVVEGLVMMGEIGLIFNMFEQGIALDVALLRKTGTRAVAMSILAATLALGAGIGVGVAFGLSFQGAFALGTVFVQTASATVIPVLRKAKLLNTPVGQMIIAATVIDDLITLALLAVLNVFGPNEGISTFDYFVPVLTSIAWLSVLGIIGITLAPKLIEEYILPRFPRQQDKHFVIFVMMATIFVAYLPLLHFTKSSYLIGAFLCGATFSQVKLAHDLFFEKSQGFIDWGYKLFFAVKIGFQVPVKLFRNPGVWIMVAVLVPTAMSIKFVGALAVPKVQEGDQRALYNHHRHNQIIAGLSMMSRGGFGFMAAGFAVSRGIIDLETYASAVATLLIGIIVPSSLLTFFTSQYQKREWALRAQKCSSSKEFDRNFWGNIETGDKGFTMLMHSIDLDGDEVLLFNQWSDMVKQYYQKKMGENMVAKLLSQTEGRARIHQIFFSSSREDKEKSNYHQTKKKEERTNNHCSEVEETEVLDNEESIDICVVDDC